ncbi:unnamed protein product [Caenorhabditis brenneri]
MAIYLSGEPYWSTYARVRLDMKNEDDIHYFTDLDAFNQSLYSNPPDSSLGYMDNTTGSDMFSIIIKFLKNTQYLCGSTVVIAAKRYPNEVEIEDLISELQKNHVFVYILSSDTPSGGSNPSAMFNLATRTNGYCVFSTEHFLEFVYSNAKYLTSVPNQIAAQKLIVSGKGNQIIPFKTLWKYNNQLYVNFNFIFQDHKMDGSLKFLNWTVTDDMGYTYPYHTNLNTQYTSYFSSFLANNTVQYYLNIDYEYEEGRQEVMVVRIYCANYIPDYWLPFSN